MEKLMNDFHMPRYHEIPDVGLYMEQAIKYINGCLKPLEISITASMVSNYVKKGYIDRPVRKQYYSDQIAYLLFIAVAKQTLSMENISALFGLQKQTYSLERAYNYFCCELEGMLESVFDSTQKPPEEEREMPFAKQTLRSVIIAISHIIYLNYCFKNISSEDLG
jgi:hypothetical protein